MQWDNQSLWKPVVLGVTGLPGIIQQPHVNTQTPSNSPRKCEPKG